MSAETALQQLQAAMQKASATDLIAFVTESELVVALCVLCSRRLFKNIACASMLLLCACMCVCVANRACAVVNENTPLFVSRSALQQFAQGLPKLPREVHVQTATSALAILQVCAHCRSFVRSFRFVVARF